MLPNERAVISSLIFQKGTFNDEFFIQDISNMCRRNVKPVEETGINGFYCSILTNLSFFCHQYYLSINSIKNQRFNMVSVSKYAQSTR